MQIERGKRAWLHAQGAGAPGPAQASPHPVTCALCRPPWLPARRPGPNRLTRPGPKPTRRFMPNHAAALREACRVLKPGGAFAATVWQPEERMPFFLAVKQLATEYEPAQVQAAANMAVRFGEPAGLLEDLRGAGLAEARAEGIEVDYFLPVGGVGTVGWGVRVLVSVVAPPAGGEEAAAMPGQQAAACPAAQRAA